MSYWRVMRRSAVVCLVVLAACTPDNIALGPNEAVDPIETRRQIELEAARESVAVTRGEQRQAVAAPERIAVQAGQTIAVDEVGRAVLRFGDVLMLEMLRGSQVEIRRFSVDEQRVEIDLRHNGGVLIADLTESPEIEHQLNLETEYATVTAGGARFAVVAEPVHNLEWIVALQAGQDDLQVTAEGVSRPLIGGQARWVAPTGEPSAVISANNSGEAWLGKVRNTAPDLALSELLLAPANVLADTGSIGQLAEPGTVFELGGDVQGMVDVTLDPQGIFGNPVYTLEDCNGDGVQDIAVVNGVIEMDFRRMLGRVQALDVSVFNRDEPGNGSLQVFDPAHVEIDRRLLEVGPDESQTLSIRSNQFFHSARLAVSNACFIGFSLTPPGQEREIVAVQTQQPITENLQSDEVVNVLQTPTERRPENGQFEALFVGENSSVGPIVIDGAQEDWDALARQPGQSWTTFSTVTYDSGCAVRYPDSGSLTDLSGRVQLAYDNEQLYVAFVINDDGLVTYSGNDERYFLGDSPQLLLDLDLNSDFDEAQLSADDVQIDFRPDPNAPQAALWQLSTLASRQYTGATIAVTPTDTGYFLEAALPWSGLGLSLRPGDRLGLVASVSDNDTPQTNAQECIISTAANRDWQNPTTWGTVLLRPEN